MSVNQMAAYHVLIETFNIIHFGSVEKIRQKILAPEIEPDERQTRSSTRGDLKLQVKLNKKCMRFSYTAPLLWNMVPLSTRNTTSPNKFKFLVKRWIWDGNIPL